ncbi:hypothetical protein [Mesorhizobium sp. B2-8-3]|nr:hypothetical protein [Mesorhizobium sp. B2-8-3]
MPGADGHHFGMERLGCLIGREYALDTQFLGGDGLRLDLPSRKPAPY